MHISEYTVTNIYILYIDIYVLYHTAYVCTYVLCITQDIPGAQQDVVFALLLDSDNQDSQSILARVFPGQSVHEILKSRCALQQKEQLADMIAKSVQRPESTVSKESDLSSDESLYGIDLKVIDSSELEQTGESAFSNVPAKLDISDSKLDFEQNFDIENLLNEQEVTLSPRTKNAVSRPLPPIPTTSGGVMPDLKLCLNESQFHADMYYSKREVSYVAVHTISPHTYICMYSGTSIKGLSQ